MTGGSFIPSLEELEQIQREHLANMQSRHGFIPERHREVPTDREISDRLDDLADAAMDAAMEDREDCS